MSYKIKKPCTCGDREICTNKVRIHFYGALSVDADNLLSCGKIKQDIRKTGKAYKAHKLSRNR